MSRSPQGGAVKAGAAADPLWRSNWEDSGGFGVPAAPAHRLAVFDFDCTLTSEHLFCECRALGVLQLQYVLVGIAWGGGIFWLSQGKGWVEARW